jgi:hypothetical protein
VGGNANTCHARGGPWAGTSGRATSQFSTQLTLRRGGLTFLKPKLSSDASGLGDVSFFKHAFGIPIHFRPRKDGNHMRVGAVVFATVLAYFASLTSACFASDWYERLSKACMGRANSEECFRLCKQAQDSRVSEVEMANVNVRNCEYALRNGEGKPLTTKACNQSSCIVKMTLTSKPKSPYIYSGTYSGGGFKASYQVSGTGSLWSKWITIESPEKTKTVIVQHCGGNACAPGWEHKSGPLKSAQISEVDKRTIILQFVK